MIVEPTEGAEMRPSTRNSDRAAERSVEVLDAAATVLARKGYDATSIDDIADELGATKGRVYHYYRSKGDILRGVLDAGMQRLTDEVMPFAEENDTPADVRLYRMCRAHALTMMAHHSYQVVNLRSIEGGPAAGKGFPATEWGEVMARRREYEQNFVRVLEEGCAAGLFAASDARLTARALLGTLNWITVWFDPAADPSGKASPEAIAEQLARFAVAGARYSDQV